MLVCFLVPPVLLLSLKPRQAAKPIPNLSLSQRLAACVKQERNKNPNTINLLFFLLDLVSCLSLWSSAAASPPNSLYVFSLPCATIKCFCFSSFSIHINFMWGVAIYKSCSITSVESRINVSASISLYVCRWMWRMRRGQRTQASTCTTCFH